MRGRRTLAGARNSGHFSTYLRDMPIWVVDFRRNAYELTLKAPPLLLRPSIVVYAPPSRFGIPRISHYLRRRADIFTVRRPGGASRLITDLKNLRAITHAY